MRLARCVRSCGGCTRHSFGRCQLLLVNDNNKNNNSNKQQQQTKIKKQVGVPSRTEVAEYRDLGTQVNELVGRINGNYGTLEYSPVHYINQSISQVKSTFKTTL